MQKLLYFVVFALTHFPKALRPKLGNLKKERKKELMRQH